MSAGNIIGGFVGGVGGFLIGGPAGAAIGMSIGMGVGGLIDPIDMNSNIGAPEAQTVTAAGEGKVIAELLGTSKIQGNIFWHGNERAVEIEQETGAKGGGNDTTVVGYNYFADWALGLCMGEVDVLYSIGDRDKIIMSIPQERVVSGCTSVALDNGGTAKIYWGTNNQEADSTMGNEALNYRNLCFILFKNYPLGQSPSIPSLYAVLTRRPLIDGFNTVHVDSNVIDPDDPEKTLDNEFDYNPAACSYYILNSMIGVKHGDIDLSSFTSAASTLYTEKLGVSMLMNRSVAALTYQESIMKHIDSHLSWGDVTTTTTSSTTTTTTP